MKKLPLLLLIACAPAFGGGIMISQLPPAPTPNGAEILPESLGTCTPNSITCGITLSQIGTYAIANASSLGKLDLTLGVKNVLPIANGGTGTTTPGLIGGTNCTITGSWPNQTVSCTGGSGSGITQLTGDVTAGPGSGSQAATVVKVNGLAIPVSAACTGTNANGQFIPATNCVTTTGTPASGNIAAFSGPATVTTATSAQIASALSSTPQAITVASCTGCGSGTGSPGGTSLSIQYNNAGSFGGIASPTTGPGSYVLRFDPTSTTAVAPSADQVGAIGRAISGATSTDTALYSDVLGIVLHDKAGSATVNETLPTPTSLSNAHFAYNYCNDSTHTDTITPTTWTIALNGGAAGASISVLTGQCATVTVDPFNASQWDAFTYGATSSSGGSQQSLINAYNNNSISQASSSFVLPSEGTTTFAGTIKNLYASTASAPASGQTFTITLYTAPAVGGSFTATSLTCQITSTSTGNGCSDTTDSVSVTVGNVYELHVTTSATSGATGTQSYTMEIDH